MNPLAFVTFFTVGELGMMSALALAERGGGAALVAELSGARDVLFWLLLGGFVWVVGTCSSSLQRSTWGSAEGSRCRTRTSCGASCGACSYSVSCTAARGPRTRK